MSVRRTVPVFVVYNQAGAPGRVSGANVVGGAWSVPGSAYHEGG